MVSLSINDSFDTACMVAFYRALESERPGGYFRDPYARQLAGERGEEIIRLFPDSEAERWAFVTRTCVYDEIILCLIEQEEIDTVVNLGAGFDVRPYRLSLPAALHWIEADLPAIITHKEQKLAHEQPLCQLERVACDIASCEERRALLRRIGSEAKQALVLAEGLLVYLPTNLVAELARELHEQVSLRWWLTEFTSPLVLRRDDTRWNTFAAESVKTRFTPPGGIAFFRQCGWDVAEFRAPIQEALRLKLPLHRAWLLRLLTFILTKQPEDQKYNAGGFFLLKRG